LFARVILLYLGGAVRHAGCLEGREVIDYFSFFRLYCFFKVRIPNPGFFVVRFQSTPPTFNEKGNERVEIIV